MNNFWIDFFVESLKDFVSVLVAILIFRWLRPHYVFGQALAIDMVIIVLVYIFYGMAVFKFRPKKSPWMFWLVFVAPAIGVGFATFLHFGYLPAVLAALGCFIGNGVMSIVKK